MSKPKLSPKQERFCKEYVIDLNGTQAAKRAGYSPNGADVAGTRLLANASVTQRISELQAKVTTKLQITAERVLAEIARLAFFDLRKLYNAAGELFELHQLDEDTARAISGIDVNVLKAGDVSASTIRRIKTADKKGALELLAKHLGLINEKLHVTLDDPALRVVLVAPDSGRDKAPSPVAIAK